MKAKIGRPPKAKQDRVTRLIATTITDEEYRRLKANCLFLNATASVLIRQRIQDLIGPQQPAKSWTEVIETKQQAT